MAKYIIFFKTHYGRFGYMTREQSYPMAIGSDIEEADGTTKIVLLCCLHSEKRVRMAHKILVAAHHNVDDYWYLVRRNMYLFNDPAEV